MTEPLSNLDACIALLRVSKSALEDRQKDSDRSRLAFSMNNGKEHTGTSLFEKAGAWVLLSGSAETMINPLSVSTVKLLD